ncbi:Heavy metal transporter [Gammaproteobacteria bacterium]
MQTERFTVRNVKCNGCVTTIRKNLLALSGIDFVEVTLSAPSPGSPTESSRGSTVAVQGLELSREVITKRLAELGYPVLG